MNRKRMFRSILLAVAIFAVWSLPGAGPREVRFVPTALAEETWLTEMNEICARSNDAMTFSDAELQRLIERCDRLKPRIEVLDESTRKVYGRRLLMCRQLYAYVLEGRKENEKERK
jgi:hypothetical protein